VLGCCQRAPVRWMDAVQVRDCARASGVRALVVGVYGALLDDFVVQAPPRQVHVLMHRHRQRPPPWRLPDMLLRSSLKHCRTSSPFIDCDHIVIRVWGAPPDLGTGSDVTTPAGSNTTLPLVTGTTRKRGLPRNARGYAAAAGEPARSSRQ
jgi:hypothetical protein